MLYADQPVLMSRLDDRGHDFDSLFGTAGRGNLESLHAGSPASAAIVEVDDEEEQWYG